MNVKLGAAAALTAMLALTACSSDGDDTAEPAQTTTATAEATAEPTPEATQDTTAGNPGTIVEVASGNEDFSTLVAAVQAAGLVETLSGDGPFTVFAPTDEAFAALPSGVLDALLLPENKEVLTQILTYHVVPGEVTSSQITAGEVTTVEGQPVTIATDAGVTVNGATVVTADVEASNGVIHVVDAVLLPPGVDPAALL